MKNICSFKTIIILFLALFVFMGAHKAFAGQLTEQEEVWLKSYLTYKPSRPAVRMAFWMDMRNQVEEMVETLPYLVHENIMLVGMKYDQLKSVSYTYVVNNNKINLDLVKNKMVGVLCSDPQTLLYLITFEGDFTYSYFLYGDWAKVWYEINISAVDCGPGI